MKIAKNIRWIVLASLCAGLLAACGGGDEEVKVNTPVKKAAVAVVPTATPTPTPDDSEEYTYNPIGKRDPFKSFLAEEIAPGSQKALTPLQRYDIDQLNVIGIIWGISTPRAMVTTPDAKGYVVQKGTLVGKNWGKVSRITQDEVIVSEEYRDFEGKLIVHEIPLKMPKDANEEEVE
ncbi:MAG TPA: pilus assembly protein PilP [bacterium]|nr:pilus assembly protein PilP [bacterium]